MQVQHVGHKIRGFYRLADYALRWGMIAPKAQRRLQILNFWQRHGLAATGEAFQVSRRTLFLWRERLRAEGGNVAALVPGSTAPKRRRQRQWPAAVVGEIRRLRQAHPNLGKEKLHLLLLPFAATQQLPCPSARTIGRLIADATDKMRSSPRTFGGPGKAKLVRHPRLRKPKHFQAHALAIAWPWTVSSCGPRRIAATSSPAPTSTRTSLGPGPPAATPAPLLPSSSA